MNKGSWKRQKIHSEIQTQYIFFNNWSTLVEAQWGRELKNKKTSDENQYFTNNLSPSPS